MRINIGLSIILGIFVAAGCQSAAPAVANIPEADPSPVNTPLPDTAVTPDRTDPNMAKTPERIPPTEVITPITGEVPADLLDSIVKDLSERTGAPREKIAVIQDQEIVWNDGSLGCAQPGEFYTQALVQGYWVILELDGMKYDYRVAASGRFFICAQGIPPGRPATPES
ncbi:MAG: hypothetical protein QY306_09360 [Anaerolineales bacterium]|nr:MAG: hypothetical protein QY306_09360 [Anaerolineales bacterium]